jgi:small subunit ribosomal protein S21
VCIVSGASDPASSVVRKSPVEHAAAEAAAERRRAAAGALGRGSMPNTYTLAWVPSLWYLRGPSWRTQFMPSDAIQCKPLEVVVSDRGIERAIKMLKRKLASEGVLRELKMRRHYMKPSVKRRKKQAEAARRRRKRAKMDAAPPKP